MTTTTLRAAAPTLNLPEQQKRNLIFFAGNVGTKDSVKFLDAAATLEFTVSEVSANKYGRKWLVSVVASAKVVLPAWGHQRADLLHAVRFFYEQAIEAAGLKPTGYADTRGNECQFSYGVEVYCAKDEVEGKKAAVLNALNAALPPALHHGIEYARKAVHAVAVASTANEALTTAAEQAVEAAKAEIGYEAAVEALRAQVMAKASDTLARNGFIDQHPDVMVAITPEARKAALARFAPGRSFFRATDAIVKPVL